MTKPDEADASPANSEGVALGKMCANNGTQESDELLQSDIHKDPIRAEKLRIATIVVSIVSVICTFAEGAATLVIAIIESSAASFAFALTALLDSMTSIVVIWRYCGDSHDIFAIDKERRALFFLGILFVISFFTTFTKSVYALAQAVLPRRDALTWCMAVINTLVSASLAAAKFYLSAQLDSRSIFTDGINSAIATILAIAIIASSVIYDIHKGVWFLDAVTGVICACFLLVYGSKLLYNGRHSMSKLLVQTGRGRDQDKYLTMDEK